MKFCKQFLQIFRRIPSMIMDERDKFSILALREMNILKRLDSHPNLVKLLDIVIEKDANLNTSTYFVFEYCEHDLEGMMMSNIRFNLPQIKRIIHSILNGLSELHKKNIIHRDIKTDNILYNKNKEVKVADFGLSKDLNIKRAPLSRKLQHMFYRAPESLFGSQHYSFKVDIWCAGIIFYQMLFRNQENCTYKILFPANNDEQLRQAKNYFNLLGNPEHENIWPSSSRNELKMKEFDVIMSQITTEEKANFKNRFIEHLKGMNPNVDDCALSLLCKMITLDPAQRFSADECLQHPFFTSEPKMADYSEMPQIDDQQEYHQFTQKNNFINERQKQIQELQQIQLQAANGNAIANNTPIAPAAPSNIAGPIPGHQLNQIKRNKPQNLSNNQRNGQNKMIMNGQSNHMFPPNGQVPNTQGGVSPLPNQPFNGNRFNNPQQGKNPNMQLRFQQQQYGQNLQQSLQQKQPYLQQNGFRKQLGPVGQNGNMQGNESEVINKSPNVIGNNFNSNMKNQKRNPNNQNTTSNQNQNNTINIQQNPNNPNIKIANNNQYNSMQYKSNNLISSNSSGLTYSFQNAPSENNNNNNNPQNSNIFFINSQKQQQQQGVSHGSTDKTISQQQQSQIQNQFPNSSNFYKGGKAQLLNQDNHQVNPNPISIAAISTGQIEKSHQIDSSYQEDQQNFNNYSESTEVSNQENMNNFKPSQYPNMNNMKTSVLDDNTLAMFSQIKGQKNSNSFTNLPNDSSRNSGCKKFQDQNSNINQKRKQSLQESSGNLTSQNSQNMSKSQVDQQIVGEIRKKQKQNMTVSTNFNNRVDYSPSQIHQQSKNCIQSQDQNNFSNIQQENPALTPTQPSSTIQQVVSPILQPIRSYATSFDLLAGSSYIKGMESQQQMQQLNQLKNACTTPTNVQLQGENKLGASTQAGVNTTGLQILQQIAQDGSQMRRSFTLGGSSHQPQPQSIQEGDGGIQSKLSQTHSLTQEKSSVLNQQALENSTIETPDFNGENDREENNYFYQGRQYYSNDKGQHDNATFNSQRGGPQKLNKKMMKQMKRNEKSFNKNKQLTTQYSNPNEQIGIQGAAPYEQIIDSENQGVFQAQFVGAQQTSLHNLNNAAAPQSQEQNMGNIMEEEPTNTPVQQKCSSTSSTTAQSHHQNTQSEEQTQEQKASQTIEPPVREQPYYTFENSMNTQDTFQYNMRGSISRKTSDNFINAADLIDNCFGRQPSFCAARMSMYGSCAQSPYHFVDSNYMISPNHLQFNEYTAQNIDINSPFLLAGMPSSYPMPFAISNHTSGDGTQN